MTSNTRKRRCRGFTLVEILVAIAVVAILGSIAFPTYTEYVYETRRKEAPQALLELMWRMEGYYADQASYIGATVAGLMGSTVTEHGFYTLSINNLTAETYALHATPTGSHTDDACGTFLLTSTGVKNTLDGSLASTKCW